MALIASMASAQEAYKPHFNGDPAHSSAEASALGYMRTVVDAERNYKKKHNKYATSLAALVGSGSFTRRMVRTERGDYTASFHSTKVGFAVLMTPKQFDAMHRAFWTNANGIIRAETDKPATEDSPVLAPD